MGEAIITRRGGGGTNKTLPPQVTGLTAKAGNAQVTITFEDVPAEYQQYLKDYVLVYKAGGIPQSPTDGTRVVIPK